MKSFVVARKPQTEERYNAVQAAFVEFPAEFAKVARLTGEDHRTVRTLWDRGWPSFEWAVPISRGVTNEGRRAASVSPPPSTPLMTADAYDQAAREVQATRGALQSGMALLATASRLLKACQPSLERAAKNLNDPNRKHSDREAFLFVRRLAYVTDRSVSVIQKAMTLERLRVGAPESIIGVVHSQREVFDPVKARRTLGSDDEIRGAIIDLANGEMTERAILLIEASSPEAEVNANGVRP